MCCEHSRLCERRGSSPVSSVGAAAAVPLDAEVLAMGVVAMEAVAAVGMAARAVATAAVATVVATEERRSPHQHSSAPRAPS